MFISWDLLEIDTDGQLPNKNLWQSCWFQFFKCQLLIPSCTITSTQSYLFYISQFKQYFLYIHSIRTSFFKILLAHKLLQQNNWKQYISFTEINTNWLTLSMCLCFISVVFRGLMSLDTNIIVCSVILPFVTY